MVGVLFYTFAIGFSFVNARVTLGMHVVVAFFYILDQCVAPDLAEREIRNGILAESDADA